MAKENSVDTLRNRVLRACSWTIGGHVSGQVLRLGTNLVMTRFLVPEMFGIMAIANVIMYGFQMFSDLGIRQSVIQSKRGNDPEFLNTAWIIQIVRGVLIVIASILLSFLIHYFSKIGWWRGGSVYTDPALPMVIICLSFNALLSGFESTKIAIANRNLDFRSITFIELASQAVGLVFMIIWVMFDASIWALVCGSLLTSAVRMSLSHIILPGVNNRLQWDLAVFFEIINFGKWVFLSSVISFVAASADRFILAGVADTATLGIYAISLVMLGAVKDAFIKLIGSVVLPTLGEVVRERRADLKKVYYQLRYPIDALTSFATGFLFLTAHLIIEILYDERYHGAGYMLQVLSLSIFELRYSIVGQCFLALGQPRLLTRLSVIRPLVLFGGLSFVYSQYGIYGAVWVVTAGFLLPVPYIVYLKYKFDLLDIYCEIKSFWWLVVGVVLGWGVKSFCSNFYI